MDDNIAFKNIKSLSFGILSTEDIKKISVLEITNEEILDSLGHAATNGLYDLRLGPNDRDEICQTCGLNDMCCPGHSSHINLPVKVYNPVFFQYLYQLLRGTCFKCHRLLVPPAALQLSLFQLQALDYGLVSIVKDLREIATEAQNNPLADIDVVISKLERKFKEALEESKSNNTNRHPVKSVVECRRNIVKTFVKTYLMGAKDRCPNCKEPKKKIVKYNMRLVYRDSAKPASIESTRGVMEAEAAVASEIVNKELMPEEARTHLAKLWENDRVFLGHFFKTLGHKRTDSYCPIDMFFMDTILVPPSRFRRLIVMKGKKLADQTLTFNEVLKDCILLRIVKRKMDNMELTPSEEESVSKCVGKTLQEKYSKSYQQLQRHVTEIFDSDVNKDRNTMTKGIKQILEKKEGLFRMNMMGKRVNYAARSVISPDPYIMVDEIGIPLVFAKKLTFPEPVTHRNVENLRRAVMNGPQVYPGASIVEMENGEKVRLPADNEERRQELANKLLNPQNSAVKKRGRVKVVHRHIKNGDHVLLNRQPTLHRPSLMAHKARILPGEKTLRLHYSNCKSYNADFDGDEMNCHVPQSYLGQAECLGLASVNHQYLVPKDGTPLGGLIQDHITAGVLLTKRGRFFPKDQYQQLIFSALPSFHKRVKLLPPAILKPQRLWSGKQVVSTIIINLIPEGKIPPTVEGKAKVSQKNWKATPAREKSTGDAIPVESMSESEVIIRHGELLCGVIDKAQIGPTPYSFIHMCYELYGGEVSNTILTALARLSTHYLQYYSGFSLGIEDICVNEEANNKRRKILRKSKKKGLTAAATAFDEDNQENLDLEELLTKYKDIHHCRDDFGLKILDMEMKNVTGSLNNKINEVCIPEGLRKKFPYNNLQLMVESGAKGSSVNAMQISCLLGQIELEGGRMPLMLNGRTLPSFKSYDTSPQAGGFVGGRFLTGINQQEYFFHCLAGREGLIDTAVKTSRSGYLQRCLIKHLEGVTVQYDQTVRDSDGTVIQFLYGEDGMDPLKMQLLKKNRLHLLGMNYEAAFSERQVQALKQMVDVDLDKEKKKIKRWKKKHFESSKQRSSLVPSVSYKMGDNTARVSNIISQLEEFSEKDKKIFEKSKQRCPDAINSKFSPDSTFGSVSENMDSLISDYVSKDPHGLLSYGNEDEEGKRKKTLSPENFKDLCYYHSMKSLADPGDTVGLLAAQSIGEPSTQMTLNTFHFAGKGEMNVTLGMPRIREILMTASPNIATPTMDLPFLDQPDIEEKANALKLKLSPVSLKDLLDGVKIKEFLSVSNGKNTRNYTIKFEFLEFAVYKGHVNTTPSKILFYMEHSFIQKFTKALSKKINKSRDAKPISVTKESQMSDFKNDFGDGDDDSSPPHAEEPTKADDGHSSEESEGEGDTTSAKSKKQRDQGLEYDDPKDEEILPESSGESENEEIEIKEEIKSENEEGASYELLEPKEEGEPVIDKALRIDYVQKALLPFESNYNFDAKREHWCEITLQLPLNKNKIDMKSFLEEEISKAKIHSVPNINNAILVENPNAEDGCNLMLKTDGVNFLEIFKYVDLLDINKVYSNNIHEIAKIYGIEAAAQAIKKEIVSVFAVYGIQVDPRHLSLISDYMTCSGQYRPFSRTGMAGNASPLQQITFETSKNFLVEAMVMGIDDRMASPSANIIVGQLPPAGTGCFNLLRESRQT